MKTTLVLADEVARRLKAMAIGEGRSMSSIVEEAFTFLEASRGAGPTPVDLPTFRAGVPKVDVADRDVLYSATQFTTIERGQL